MARGIKRKVFKARNRVDEEIRVGTDQSNLYSRGLAGEGYLGGYRDALDDVILLLNGVKPNRRRDIDYWEE